MLRARAPLPGSYTFYFRRPSYFEQASNMTPLGQSIELTVPYRDGRSVGLPMADDNDASLA